ncbi:nitroreductase family protein [Candidatus Omnitrophota bacterium]
MPIDTLDIIRQRRSVREYEEKVPSYAEIEKILEAARWAPSGLNNQPWRFLVIKEKSKKNGLTKFTKYRDVIKNAPVVIAVFMDIADSYNRDKDLMAIGASIQNMILEAYALGLGTCWLGEILNKKQEVLKYLKVDNDLEFLALVVIGYPKEGLLKGCRSPLKSLTISL